MPALRLFPSLPELWSAMQKERAQRRTCVMRDRAIRENGLHWLIAEDGEGFVPVSPSDGAETAIR